MIDVLAVGFRRLMAAHARIPALVVQTRKGEDVRSGLVDLLGPYWLPALFLVPFLAMWMSVGIWLELQDVLDVLIPPDSFHSHDAWIIAQLIQWPLWTVFSMQVIAAVGFGILIQWRTMEEHTGRLPTLPIILLAIITTTLAILYYWIYQALFTALTTEMNWNDHQAWVTPSGQFVHPFYSPGFLILREVVVTCIVYISSLWMVLAVLWAFVRAGAVRAIPLRLALLVGGSWLVGLWWAVGMRYYNPEWGSPQPDWLTQYTNDSWIMTIIVEIALAVLFVGWLVGGETAEEGRDVSTSPAEDL